MFRSTLRALVSVNPKTNQVVRSWTEMTPKEVQDIIVQSREEFGRWSTLTVDERMERLSKVGTGLRENTDACAQLIHEEMGKPLNQATAEVLKCAQLVDFYVDNAAKFLASTPMPTLTGFSESYVCYRPLGTILAIMPWNFPFWQVIRMAIPTLAAGNTVLLKHSSNVQGCALKVEELLRNAMGMDGFRTLLISSKQVDDVLSHPDVRGVALTGSTEVGRIIASRAGALLKKSVVELGGSDPYVILPDCDISFAVESCVTARLVNTGQSCISPKRIIVHTDIYDEFSAALVDRVNRAEYGREFGPLVSAQAKEEVSTMAQRSIDEGAKLLLGSPDGGKPTCSETSRDAFFQPLVLGDVRQEHTCFKEEIFGPVFALVRADNEEQALSLANDSSFGLGAAVFTNSSDGRRIAERDLDAGMCFVNDFVRSDASLPFGGTKSSGIGRECSYFGMHEFVNIKTVCVK